MKVAVTQPNYLPWLGYFDILDHVDIWIALDNVQLSKRSFVVRNRIRVSDTRWKWLTLPIEKASRSTRICDAILAGTDFAAQHARSLRSLYFDAPYSAELDWLEQCLRPTSVSLAEHNARLVRAIAARLGIAFEFHMASELIPTLSGSPEEKILKLCSAVSGVTSVYNAAGGVEAGLYSTRAFAEAGFHLYKQEYRHPQYRQGRQPFMSHLSVIDLLMHMGPESLPTIRAGRNFIRV